MKFFVGITIIFLGLLLASCKIYTYEKYHIAKRISLRTKTEYLHYLEKTRLFPINHVLYIDSASYIHFITEKVQQDSSVVYLGSFVNDSTMLRRSNVLSENTSCASRMIDEIRRNSLMRNYFDDILTPVKKLSSYQLSYLVDGSRYEFDNNGKLNIFLNFTYQAGTYYDNFYKTVMEIRNRNKESTEVFVVLLDYVVDR